MPELPEVETTQRGIAPHILNQLITKVIIRDKRLRWPIPDNLAHVLIGHKIESIQRRGKYILLNNGHGHVILHLGMSGRIHILPTQTPAKKHDHVDIVFNEKCLRFTDPRRFGCVLWTTEDPQYHPLLANLGPEPLSDAFDAGYLYARSRKRTLTIKSFLMNSHIVVGVGNIYANEALFLAGIRPQLAAGKISRARYVDLVFHIKQVLTKAIELGGTTLRDFTASDGKPGYFQQQLYVYGRGGQACIKCGNTLKEIRMHQRSTVYCARCQ